MRIYGKVETDAVTDVVCDVCRLTTRLKNGGFQFATLQAHWGNGTKHAGERYELHLCEACFFQTIANLKQERRIQSLFCDDAGIGEEEFGLVANGNF
jgi:hypothetical protein